jgi:hypothetical protein
MQASGNVPIYDISEMPVRLLKGDPERIRVRQAETDKAGRRKRSRRRIRCPRCAWEPQRHDLWTCSCLHVWHTFDTGGVCPGCDKKWTETQCPRCRAWSRHEDWYEDEDEDEPSDEP